jgi:hypothetical protein
MTDPKPSRQLTAAEIIGLTDAEIIRALRIIRHSSRSQRNGRHIQSINAVAQAAGLSRMQCYRISNGQPIGPKARTGLSLVLRAVT